MNRTFLAKRRPGLRRALRAERLEDRTTPSSAPWVDGQHLTVSFVPDGAPIAGHQSDLFASLADTASPSVWQREILRAFQTWAQAANVDFAVVPDAGLPLGVDGRSQRDPRFGDIRIAAQPMSPETLSVSAPAEFAASGTLGGDILLNSAAAIGIGDPQADLYSILLHEIGHVLGLPHAEDPDSVMYAHAGQLRQRLSDADIAAAQLLYGVRAADQHEGSSGNASIRRATRIDEPDGYAGATPLVVYGAITEAADVDVYEVRPLAGYAGPITFRLQTYGQSLLMARMELLDSTGRLVSTGRTLSPQGGAVRLTAPSLAESYYLRVTAATNGAHAIGRYALAVTFDSRNTTPPSRLAAVLRSPYDAVFADDLDDLLVDPEALIHADAGEDDVLPGAVALKTTPGYGAFRHYEAVGSLSDAADSDLFLVKARRDRADQPMVMTVAVENLTANGVDAQVQILDRNARPLPAEIVANRSGIVVVQATSGMRPGAAYYVRVQPKTGGDQAGNYALTIDFGFQAARIQTLASGELPAGATHANEAVFIARTQLFQFQLAADSGTAPLRAIVRRADGGLVATIDSSPGAIATSPALLLTPGAYLITYGAVTTDTSPTASSFRLRAIIFGDPIGPAIEDPTLTPMYVSTTQPNSYVYPVGAPTPSPFLFHDLLPAELTPQGQPVYPPYMVEQFAWLAISPPWPL